MLPNSDRPRLFYLLYALITLGFLAGCLVLAVPQAATEATEVSVPEGMNAAPFDVPRELTVPPGFAIEVVARVNKRLPFLVSS
jgi:hypothetical protein